MRSGRAPVDVQEQRGLGFRPFNPIPKPQATHRVWQAWLHTVRHPLAPQVVHLVTGRLHSQTGSNIWCSSVLCCAADARGDPNKRGVGPNGARWCATSPTALSLRGIARTEKGKSVPQQKAGRRAWTGRWVHPVASQQPCCCRITLPLVFERSRLLFDCSWLVSRPTIQLFLFRLTKKVEKTAKKKTLPVGLGHDAGQQAHGSRHHRGGYAGSREGPAAPLDPAAHHVPPIGHHIRLHASNIDQRGSSWTITTLHPSSLRELVCGVAVITGIGLLLSSSCSSQERGIPQPQLAGVSHPVRCFADPGMAADVPAAATTTATTTTTTTTTRVEVRAL